MRQALRTYLKRDMPREMRRFYTDLERGLQRGDCDQGLRCIKSAGDKCVKWVLDASCPQLHWSQHPLRCGSGEHEGKTCVAAPAKNPQLCVGWTPEPLCPAHSRQLLLQDGQLGHLRARLKRALHEYGTLKAAGRTVHIKDGGPCPDNLRHLTSTGCTVPVMGKVDACIQRRNALNRDFSALLSTLQQLEQAIKTRLQDLPLESGLPLGAEQHLYAEVLGELKLHEKVKAHRGHEQAQQEMEKFHAYCVRALSPVPF